MVFASIYVQRGNDARRRDEGLSYIHVLTICSNQVPIARLFDISDACTVEFPVSSTMFTHP
jgi:hypothetical protein